MGVEWRDLELVGVWEWCVCSGSRGVEDWGGLGRIEEDWGGIGKDWEGLGRIEEDWEGLGRIEED